MFDLLGELVEAAPVCDDVDGQWPVMIEVMVLTLSSVTVSTTRKSRRSGKEGEETL